MTSRKIGSRSGRIPPSPLLGSALMAGAVRLKKHSSQQIRGRAIPAADYRAGARRTGFEGNTAGLGNPGVFHLSQERRNVSKVFGLHKFRIKNERSIRSNHSHGLAVEISSSGNHCQTSCEGVRRSWPTPPMGRVENPLSRWCYRGW